MVTDAAGPQRAPSGLRASVTAGQSVILLSAGWGLGGPAPEQQQCSLHRPPALPGPSLPETRGHTRSRHTDLQSPLLSPLLYWESK